MSREENLPQFVSEVPFQARFLRYGRERGEVFVVRYFVQKQQSSEFRLKSRMRTGAM